MPVIARSAATKQSMNVQFVNALDMDCFASLAMTVWQQQWQLQHEWQKTTIDRRLSELATIRKARDTSLKHILNEPQLFVEFLRDFVPIEMLKDIHESSANFRATFEMLLYMAFILDDLSKHFIQPKPFPIVLCLSLRNHLGNFHVLNQIQHGH